MSSPPAPSVQPFRVSNLTAKLQGAPAAEGVTSDAQAQKPKAIAIPPKASGGSLSKSPTATAMYGLPPSPPGKSVLPVVGSPTRERVMDTYKLQNSSVMNHHADLFH
ncbi:hypothetical protein M427DRAFT_58310 [Gonapodya prolifera JEL478]|uniref:Uncharacterized protein n=1 Tax=Gonapodya prolifera (strain JEL478) TaxID=1344416 RepID=A0A139AB64_GONPJ|nr:hypothetical protein M427DRAFT_58310 [Gonapodya prolifera JEL478]|eukprot:KXS13705.1 hypothetical protein M427DRAFT_58310 [Gonapodya prolifera JEL478]